MRAGLILLVLGLLSPLMASEAWAGPEGRWAGEWRSQTNGHHGPMRAHLRQVDDCTWRACFCGRFLGVVPFAYSVPMHSAGRTANGETILTAQSWLPGFGNFTCRAVVSDCHFRASYVSPKDRGQLTMSRN